MGGKAEKVWLYDMETDGYALDDKRAFTDGRGDTPDIIEQFRKRLEAKCFYVPATKIRENNYGRSISRYKEIEYEEVEYCPPEAIIAKIEDLEREVRHVKLYHGLRNAMPSFRHDSTVTCISGNGGV